MTTTTHKLTVAFVVKLIAKEEKADEVGAFLAGAVSLANAEAGTVVWFALRTNSTTFWKSYERPLPSAIRCAEAISQGRTEERNYPQGTPLRGLGLAAMNKFLAQMDKSQTGLVQKMHSVSN